MKRFPTDIGETCIRLFLRITKCVRVAVKIALDSVFRKSVNIGVSFSYQRNMKRKKKCS